MSHPLLSFFSPQGVALIGTSANPTKLSHGILRNMVDGSFSGKIYPVNPRYDSILGLQCFQDIGSVPDPVDLAVIALPAPSVIPALEECGKRGIKAVNIISGGFREVGAEGMALENQCLKIARKYQMRLIGPNCVGTMDLYSGLNTTFIKGLPDQGHIGFLSQSGAICGAVVDYVRGKGIGFSNFASLGNEADITESDIIEFLATDPNTHVIAAYLEGIQDGQQFIRIAKEVSKTKPIVVLKVGRSEAGARAVSSHTGSLAGTHAAYEAAFKKSNVLLVDSAAELFDVCIALVYQKPPAGKRTVIVTNSGGPAALASDSLAANGMTLSNLQPKTLQILRKNLVPSAQIENPVDMLGGAEPHEYRDALNACLEDDQVDAVLAILTPQALVNPADVANVIGDCSKTSSKTMVACFMGGESVEEARHVLHNRGVPMYVFPEQAGRVLGAMYSQNQFLHLPAEAIPELARINKTDALAAFSANKHNTAWGEAHTRPLLKAYGIPVVPGELAQNAEQAQEITARLNSPTAFKIVSPDLIHKSDVGGIFLNVHPSEAASKYHQMLSQIKSRFPDARVEGVFVEAMAPKGHEVIIGMRRDVTFGPLLMFGLGGIYVELLTDVAFGIAPLTKSEAHTMINSTKAGKLLGGLRGQAASDMDAVADCLMRLSQLSIDFPDIDEIEINPLLVFPDGNGVLAIDARALLNNKR